MSAISGIQWTDRTWNPTTGCTRVSPGCDHCYAFQLHDQRYVAKRAGKAVNGAQYDKPFSQVQLLRARIEDPLHWKKPARVFVDSMSDLFHEDVPDDYIDAVFDVMSVARQHTFQVLTKRPQRMRALLNEWAGDGYRGAPNVWLGVSVEDQQRADERIPFLLDTPAAVRFISAEPLLGPVDLRTVPIPIRGPRELAVSRLDWVIVGGESGTHARPFEVSWARELRDQCARVGTAFFMKQLGAYPRMTLDDWKPSAEAAGHPDHTTLRLKDRHGGTWDEWPADLRVREFPAVGPVGEGRG